MLGRFTDGVFFCAFFTYPPQFKHYKQELRQYLISWQSADVAVKQLLGEMPPKFQSWLENMFTLSNKRVSLLLFDEHHIDAFSSQHLVEMGWKLGS